MGAGCYESSLYCLWAPAMHRGEEHFARLIITLTFFILTFQNSNISGVHEWVRKLGNYNIFCFGKLSFQNVCIYFRQNVINVIVS